MSLWNYYRNLHPRTRMLVGGGVIVYGLVGLVLSDAAEAAFGLAPSKEDEERLKKLVPKVRVVEEREWK